MIEKIYKEYHSDVYYYIYSLCHNESLTQDLVSETFYQVMISLTNFKYKSSMKTWIFSIARNVTYKYLKQKKVEIDIDLIGEFSCLSEVSLITDEINEYIKQLPKVNQDIFNMKLEGYMYEEIAEKLNMNQNSVRVINHRNKKFLKNMLERSDLNED